MNAAFRDSGDGILVSLRVSPGAKRNAIEGWFGDSAVKVKISAPPVDGKANAEIERFLAKLFGVRKSEVEVVRGSSSRDKTVLVRGMTLAEVERRFAEVV